MRRVVPANRDTAHTHQNMTRSELLKHYTAAALSHFLRPTKDKGKSYTLDALNVKDALVLFQHKA